MSIISSNLVERASASRRAEVPRGSVVLIVGAAESGPDTPVRVDSIRDAYAAFGDGPLAQSVEMAYRGASFAAQGSGQSIRPNVFALRTTTGSPAELELKDADGRKAITLRTLERSTRANNYRVGSNRFGYRIDSPLRPEPLNVAVDKTGISARVAKSPTAFAAALREAFRAELTAEVHYREARFEVSLDDSFAGASLDGARQVIDFTGVDDTAMGAIQIAAPSNDLFTMVGREAQTDFAGDGAGLHNAILSPDNGRARVYSLTAGKAISVPKGKQSVGIRGLADAKRVGFGDTNTLLNVRTTGVGAVAAVTLQEAGEISGAKGSEAYYQVRSEGVGTFATTASADYDFGGTGLDLADALTFEFDAPAGIAGDAAGVANLPAPYTTTALAYEDRLGEHFAYTHPDAAYLGVTQHVKLELQPLGSNDLVSVPLRFDGFDADDGVTVRAEVTYTGSGRAELALNEADFGARFGPAFDDARAYVSYDSCVFEITERATAASLDPETPGLEYFVQGTTLTFNRPLEHAVVVRGTRVTQYRLGRDVTVERTPGGGNAFKFSGSGNQPGEAGGPVNKMEVIFGVDYSAEPDWPVIDSPVSGDSFTGGASGVSGDPAELSAAIGNSLVANRSEDAVAAARFIVPAGVHIDDAVVEYDELTGTPVERPCDLLSRLVDYRDKLDAEGAAGIFYLAARPLEPSTARGTFTDAQKLDRFRALTQVSSADPVRAANVVSGGSYPTFTFFDAPAEATVEGRSFTTTTAPFFAGIRSVLPNSQALYQIALPTYLRPLVKYDVSLASGARMVDLIADPGRFNVWDPRRGEVRLFSEKTGAGYLPDGQGNLVRSDLTSGYAVLAANAFRQNVARRLEILRGPMKTNVAVLRTRVEGVLRDEARNVDGIDGLVAFDPTLDIEVYADAGKALGISIDVTVQCLGEVEKIHLDVGTTGPDLGSSASGDVIPVSG